MDSLLILNFGTYAATPRFKKEAIAQGIVRRDLMDGIRVPASIHGEGGVRRVAAYAGTTAYTFHGLAAARWKSGNVADTFMTWIQQVMSHEASCVYLTGHHWRQVLSWGDDVDHFHARFRPNGSSSRLQFGVTRSMREVRSTQFRRGCRLVLGFGCDVGSANNGSAYQQFFREGGKTPIVLGWDGKIGVPHWKAPEQKQVGSRFLRALTSLGKPHGAPDQDKLTWLYEHRPDKIVEAWGVATQYWFANKATARDAAGQFYRFVTRSGRRVPVRA